MQILECIPNVSEGRRPEVIQALAKAITSVEGVKLLHIDTGYAANRAVFTFAGKPEPVLKAAFALYQKATELIDMSTHEGTHPRQGAVDVCPFVPLRGMTMNDAIDIASRLAFRIEDELNIPGYYYAFSATWPERRNLAYLRKGGYESLPAKLETLTPGFGNAENWKKSGVTTIGARYLLVAYNINLETKDVSIAKKIAGIIRESGTGGRAGKLKSVKAIGWYIKDFDKVQVSCNLTLLQEAGMLDVFLAVKEEAEKLGTLVTGSELIGLAPLSEFEKAGSYFNPDSMNPVQDAITGLGLDEIKPFEPQQKIIEYLLD